VQDIIKNWERSKKMFRYINRVTFVHPNSSIKLDISIVKSSSYNYTTKRIDPVYTTGESKIFENPEVYEIELEVDNFRLGPGKEVDSSDKLLISMRGVIKYILMGLQGTNFPVSYPEQRIVLEHYMKLIHGPTHHSDKRIYPSNFIGPSSYTLQLQNIADNSENMKTPNIRNNYTVTEKADGERNLMYISEKGHIYLINTNMSVMFTGAITETKELHNSLLDGEIILHNKHGKFINLYAAFDIYFINKKDVRSLGFIPQTREDKPENFRLPLLNNFITRLMPASVIKKDPSPIKIECKEFYPLTKTDSIFEACKQILVKEHNGLFDYNTDGLIFTPANMGVGVDEIGKPSPNTKSTWEHSFKWKPSKYNTIDFLVITKKNENGMDTVTPLFQDGLSLTSSEQFTEYKTILLHCGFDERKHGYINPCQAVLEDNLPAAGYVDNEEQYKPVQFYPTNPYDPYGGLCNILLKKDKTGVFQMYTEENEVFENNTIVEFRYEMSLQKQWRWVPLRVRYDKTNEFRQGLKNFGNAYHVANSNWHSIHNPITEEMISSGTNIPDEIVDEDVYYNRTNSTNRTQSLRDFHNLYVKKKLISAVSNRDDTLIDYACGKGGDFPKWIASQLSFVFGIDISKDNIENKLDGACARFLNYRKKFKTMPYALFVNGNSSANIRSGAAMLNDKAVQTTKAIFGLVPKNEEKLGKGVVRQYGKGEDGFSISSCQFALHYFFENQTTFQHFMRNVAECTKLGGYFIGTSYDGKKIFELLKKKQQGESVDLYDKDVKIWEVSKEYDSAEFEDDVSSLGYKINVYQESINKTFPEYLVNFDYLERIMENYGFKLITRDEAKLLGLPQGCGPFSELFNLMTDEVKRKPHLKKDMGTSLNMNAFDKKISFLNNYFVYKKVRILNAEKVSIDIIQEETPIKKKKKEDHPDAADTLIGNVKSKKQKVDVSSGPNIRKINKKLIVLGDDDDDEEEEPLPPPAPQIVINKEEPVIQTLPQPIVEEEDNEAEPKQEEENPVIVPVADAKEEEKEAEPQPPAKVKKPRAKKAKEEEGENKTVTKKRKPKLIIVDNP
jgi:hypothetical protein